jgi:hypothetical protein
MANLNLRELARATGGELVVAAAPKKKVAPEASNVKFVNKNLAWAKAQLGIKDSDLVKLRSKGVKYLGACSTYSTRTNKDGIECRMFTRQPTVEYFEGLLKKSGKVVCGDICWIEI